MAPRGRAAQPSRDTRKTNYAKQLALSYFPIKMIAVLDRLRFSYDVQECLRNFERITYDFRIGEFVAKFLNSSKLLNRIPDRPTIARIDRVVFA